MNQHLVDRVVNAVLYEGYILYPYRPSVKNRQRWTFGGLYPRAHCEDRANGDAWMMQTECLVAADAGAMIEVKVRFLHLVQKTVGQIDPPVRELPDDGEAPFRPVAMLEVGGKLHATWQEAVEREVTLGETAVNDLVGRPRRHEFSFPASRQVELLRHPAGGIAGVNVREQEEVRGTVELAAAQAGDGLAKVTVRILNDTKWEGAARSRDAVLMRALVSTHTVLDVRGGEFISLLEPPEPLRELAASCRNVGTWPVLVGSPGDKDTMLSSPIILYDYPQVAPESPGDLFDGTEIDEILTLRILTLTEDEKRAAGAVDERARALLQRTESLTPEQLLGLHGTLRQLPVGEPGA